MSDQDLARRPVWVTAVLLMLSVVLIGVFVLLGNWQMRRLAWKQDLIASVQERAFGVAADLPDNFDPEQHAYQRVMVQGRFVDTPAVLVKAVTEIGPGLWVMSPLQTDRGILWVNRGYVHADVKSPENWTKAQSPVTGLLRPSAENGTLLERNDPAIDRWVSRDTAAMSRARGLGATLPYFLDADHDGASGSWPRGGLTVITFNNSHLSYALTWYAMAGLFAVALVYVVRTGRSESE
ncbi:MAG: SURF1 family protein [Pseudomonadota bacterium]